MIFKPQSSSSGLYVNNVTLRSNRRLTATLTATWTVPKPRSCYKRKLDVWKPSKIIPLTWMIENMFFMSFWDLYILFVVRQLQILGDAVIAMLSVWLLIIWQAEITINDCDRCRKCVLQNTQAQTNFLGTHWLHHSKSKGRTESHAASIIKYATQDYVYLAYLKC